MSDSIKESCGCDPDSKLSEDFLVSMTEYMNDPRIKKIFDFFGKDFNRDMVFLGFIADWKRQYEIVGEKAFDVVE